MDFPWGAGRLPAPSAGDLNLLDGDNLLLELDDRTLQCLVAPHALPSAGEDADEAGPSGSGKRRRQDAKFSQWLADDFCATAEGEEEGPEEDSTGEESNTAGKRKGRKKALSEAAAAKASREKARRERLNELFDELGRLCDPSGKGSKADRVSVVVDAIRVVQQLRVENNQLRQLNKFLEERTGAYERARAQTMFQQAAAAAHQQHAAAPAQALQHPQQTQQAQPQGQLLQQPVQVQVQAQQAGQPWQQQLQQQMQQQMQQLQQQAQQLQAQQAQGSVAQQAMMPPPGFPAAAPSGAGAMPPASAAYAPCEILPAPYMLSAQMPVGAGPQGEVHHVLVPIHAGSLAGQVFALKQEHLVAAGLGGGGGPGGPPPGSAAAGMAHPEQAPPVGWLPAPNLSEDQKLRPPAA